MKQIETKPYNAADSGVERLERVLEYLRLSKNALGVSIGDKNGMRITNVLTQRNLLSEKLAKDITDVYPSINYSWLLKGEGNMLNDEINNASSPQRFDKNKLASEADFASIRAEIKLNYLMANIAKLMEKQLPNENAEQLVSSWQSYAGQDLAQVLARCK